jgi:nucleoside-triphosphatase THEP1
MCFSDWTLISVLASKCCGLATDQTGKEVINILTGPVHSGKTTLLKSTIPLLAEKHILVDGYLSIAVWKNKKFHGYDLLDLRENKSYPFILKQGQQEWQKIGRFFFIPEALDLANEIIRRSRIADLCVVDEVGPLELSGKGIWPSLEIILSSPEPQLLLVIRDTILDKVMKKIRRDDMVVHDIEQNETPRHLADSLCRDLGRKKEQERK